MKIIKKGNLNRDNSMRRFNCPYCGCIWEANATEYRTEWERNCEWFECDCPTCHRQVWRGYTLC